MARRRALFVSKLTPSYDYITIVNSFSNAAVARTEIDSIFTARGIDRTNKILVFKSAAQIANNQFLCKSWINLATDTGIFVRYRNLNVNNQTWGSLSGDCVGAVGDTYYVIDPTLQNQAQDFSVTVQSAITKADDLLSLIQASMPSTGVYAVYRNFNPSELAQYDYLWSLHAGTSSQYGVRADNNMRESPVTDWNNAYDTHVNAGDKLYFLKLFDT